jgi:hypothetical protein
LFIFYNSIILLFIKIKKTKKHLCASLWFFFLFLRLSIYFITQIILKRQRKPLNQCCIIFSRAKKLFLYVKKIILINLSLINFVISNESQCCIIFSRAKKLFLYVKKIILINLSLINFVISNESQWKNNFTLITSFVIFLRTTKR